MTARPVVLLSSERSGSNLLRVLLDGHSEVSAPPPAGHVLRVLGPLLHLYSDEGGLRIDELVDDAIALTRCHGQPWEIELDRDRVLKRLRAPTLWEVFRALYELHAEAEGAGLWFAKDSEQFLYANPLRAALPDTRFVYLVRDGRDVACSALASDGHDHHIYTCARRWRDDQRHCQRFAADPAGGRGTTRTVRYEDLIERPEAELADLCAFLGIRMEARMLAFHEDPAVRRAAARSGDWANLARPVLSENRGRYRGRLRPSQVRLFESLAGPELERVGYPRDFPGVPVVEDVRFARRVLYEALDRARKRRGERRALAAEPFRAERSRLVGAIRGRLLQRTRGAARPLAPGSLPQRVSSNARLGP